MKVGAHPLVVAVALGLLAPAALEVVEDEDERTAACGDCGADDDGALPAPELAEAVRPDAAEHWATVEAPSAEDFHRVELAWLKARDSYG